MSVNAKKVIFATSKYYEPNTFIGGIGATINTRQLLADKLKINVNNIKKFKVVNNNIEFYIKYFDLNQGAFELDSSITYIRSSAKIYIHPLYVFRICTNLEEINLPNADNMYPNFNSANNYCISGAPNLKILNLPSVSGVSHNFINLPNITLDYLDISGIKRATSTSIRGIKNEVINLRKLKTLVSFQEPVLPFLTAPLPTATIELNSHLLTSFEGSLDPEVTKLKTANPNLIINFYDDNGNYVSTL